MNSHNTPNGNEVPKTFKGLRQVLIESTMASKHHGKLKKLLAVAFIRSLVVFEWIAWPFIQFGKFEDYIMSKRNVWLPYTRALASGATVFVALMMCMGATGVIADGGNTDVSLRSLYFWPLMLSVLVTALVGWFNVSLVRDGVSAEETFSLTPMKLVDAAFKEIGF